MIMTYCQLCLLCQPLPTLVRSDNRITGQMSVFKCPPVTFSASLSHDPTAWTGQVLCCTSLPKVRWLRWELFVQPWSTVVSTSATFQYQYPQFQNICMQQTNISAQCNNNQFAERTHVPRRPYSTVCVPWVYRTPIVVVITSELHKAGFSHWAFMKHCDFLSHPHCHMI